MRKIRYQKKAFKNLFMNLQKIQSPKIRIEKLEAVISKLVKAVPTTSCQEKVSELIQLDQSKVIQLIQKHLKGGKKFQITF